MKSQPHVWTEITRYDLSISETKDVLADRVSLLLDKMTFN